MHFKKWILMVAPNGGCCMQLLLSPKDHPCNRTCACRLLLQYLCCEVADLQRRHQLRQLRVCDVAHMAWRLRVACDLDGAVKAFEQVRTSLLIPLGQLCSTLLAMRFPKRLRGEQQHDISASCTQYTAIVGMVDVGTLYIREPSAACYIVAGTVWHSMPCCLVLSTPGGPNTEIL